jgi:hypothetical protein
MRNRNVHARARAAFAYCPWKPRQGPARRGGATMLAPAPLLLLALVSGPPTAAEPNAGGRCGSAAAHVGFQWLGREDSWGLNTTAPAQCCERCLAVAACHYWTWLGGDHMSCFLRANTTTPNATGAPRAEAVCGKVGDHPGSGSWPPPPPPPPPPPGPRPPPPPPGPPGPCKTALDCELLGTCTGGTCHCSPGFTGPSCGQLDLLPVPATTRGKVWPVTEAPYVKHDRTKHHDTIGWSFAPAYDPKTQRYIAAVENTCDEWGGDTWLAAVSSDRPDGGFRFERRLGPAGTNCPHMKRLKNGTFALYLDAFGLSPANETKDPTAPICVGDSVTSPEQMAPVLRPCGAGEGPNTGHNCLCAKAPGSCTGSPSGGVYVASTDHWPDGPWRIAALSITGPGWSPYNSTLGSIGTSNPTAVQLADGRTLVSFRSHAGYWPQIESKVTHRCEGEHTGFALGESIEGPFKVSGNLSWEYGNDEDPFVWQQRDGSFHCLYHNGRGSSTNHGLHTFSTDGKTWHKPSDALLPACARRTAVGEPTPSMHNCSALYTNAVELDDGTTVVLSGRERPALLFDEVTGAPTFLYNGAIDANRSVPWYAMAQHIRS